ncbi:MAG: hypothetical protein JNM72_09495 [Deltaproteobacteria bacterium]|nr:hypothetical protein [Deltaproteobacteria bacterium]
MSRALGALLRAAGLVALARLQPVDPGGDPVVLVVDQAEGRWMVAELRWRSGRPASAEEPLWLRRPRWPRIDEGDVVYAILDETSETARLRRPRRLPAPRPAPR